MSGVERAARFAWLLGTLPTEGRLPTTSDAVGYLLGARAFTRSRPVAMEASWGRCGFEGVRGRGSADTDFWGGIADSDERSLRFFFS